MHNGLLKQIPTIDMITTLPINQLSERILLAIPDCTQNSICSLQWVTSDILNAPLHGGLPYGRELNSAQQLACSEAWQRLEAQALIVRAAGHNGSIGYYTLTRQGQQIVEGLSTFRDFQQIAELPIHLLHESIAAKVSAALLRGDYADAVSYSFTAVEISVRTASGLSPNDVGVSLMRKAFDKDRGALRDPSAHEAEREALAHLFAGAIGYFKNPFSHRFVIITDPAEAQRMVVFASQLLQIVASRSTA